MSTVNVRMCCHYSFLKYALFKSPEIPPHGSIKLPCDIWETEMFPLGLFSSYFQFISKFEAVVRNLLNLLHHSSFLATSVYVEGWRVWFAHMLTLSVSCECWTPVHRYCHSLWIGQRALPVSYLAGGQGEEGNISADKQNGCVLSCKVCNAQSIYFFKLISSLSCALYWFFFFFLYAVLPQSVSPHCTALLECPLPSC